MPDSRISRARFCAQCGAPVVVADANFCKDCGAPLANTVWFNSGISWRPRVAVALSTVPGLGHWYKGERARGLLWFIFVAMFYSSTPVLGVLLHLICACNAGLGGAIREEAIANSTRRRMRSRRRGPRQIIAQARK
jgi:zinc-ribbon domain